MTRALLSFALLLTTLLTSGVALRCWVCSSSDTGHCADPFNSTFLWQDDCRADLHHDKVYAHNLFLGAKKPVCKKVLQEERGQLIYVRSCGLESWKGQACNPEAGDRKFTDTVKFCEACSTDGCNSANTLSDGAVFFFFLPVIVLVNKILK